MSIERDGLFRELEPPPGGVARFARRLDESSASILRTRPKSVALAATTGAAIAAIVVLMLPRAPDSTSPTNETAPMDIYSAPEFDRLLGRVLRPSEVTVTLNAVEASVTPIETENSRVRIYRIDPAR
jgi:hypothetical protein